MSSYALLIIDPQIDFCDPHGALYVPGADEDCRRLAQVIRQNQQSITAIAVTLDSHHLVHIAHPIFWRDCNGEHPPCFSVIQASDVISGRWQTNDPNLQDKALEYVQKLEENGRYALVIWPPHCLIGSGGAAIQKEVYDALFQWEQSYATVIKIAKGSHPYTEHYSALRADVPDPMDPSTALNQALVREICAWAQRGFVLISGQALSHCVANTVRDLVNEMPKELISRLVLLEDTCSSVPGFEQVGKDFMSEMHQFGVQISTTEQIFGAMVTCNDN